MAQSALHKAAQQLRADQWATTQAKQAELATASMANVYTARCVLKTIQEVEICPANCKPPHKAIKLV